MPTTLGALYIVSMIALFGLWIYGAVSLYFDLRYKLLPAVAAWRSDGGDGGDDDHRQLL